MNREKQNGMQCAEFEATMAAALDGLLDGETQERFAAHGEACAVCGPAYAEALAGMQWMRALPEVEPPANLVHNILVATTGLSAAEESGPRESWVERWKQRLPRPLAPVFGAVMEPRFAMSFGMAFFSVSLLLNLLGVQLTDIRAAELSPSALGNQVVRTYNETTATVVRYYENLRFVYEIETRVRDLREATAPAPEEPAQEQRQDDSTRAPAERQQNHSRSAGKPNLALNTGAPLVETSLEAREGRKQS